MIDERPRLVFGCHAEASQNYGHERSCDSVGRSFLPLFARHITGEEDARTLWPTTRSAAAVVVFLYRFDHLDRNAKVIFGNLQGVDGWCDYARPFEQAIHQPLDRFQKFFLCEIHTPKCKGKLGKGKSQKQNVIMIWACLGGEPTR